MKTEFFDSENGAERLDRAEERPETPAIKKPFVEPAISSAVAVLESTTFFQDADSGVTN
jgi:hypothetical protein